MENLELDLKKIGSLFRIDFDAITEIHKGWSKDRKFIVSCGTEKKLLRVSALSTLARKKIESHVIEQISSLGLFTPEYYGMKTDDTYVYQLLSYLEGKDGSDSLALLPNQTQFEIGVQAGVILNQFHQIKVDDSPLFVQKEQNKILTRIHRYRVSKYYEVEDQTAIDYIQSNIDLIEQAEVRLCHGDYHIGNMIIHNNQLGIIDFNRFDYEDSYREFIPMCVFSREVSIDFCKGQLKGYFKTGIPEDFWPRVKLYLAYTALYSVLWAESFSLNEVNQMIQRKKVIFADFNHFSLTEPKWFTE